jgi:hypothetical protein
MKQSLYYLTLLAIFIIALCKELRIPLEIVLMAGSIVTMVVTILKNLKEEKSVSSRSKSKSC